MVTLVGGDQYGFLGGIDDQTHSLSLGRLAGGRLIILDNGTLGYSGEVSFTFYDDGGQRISSPVVVSAEGSGATVVGLSSGGFAIAWNQGSYPNYQIYSQVFDTNGLAVAPARAISTVGLPGEAQLVALDNDQFVVEWRQYTDSHAINAVVKTRVIDGGNSPVTGIADVTPAGLSYSSHIARLTGGTVLTAYQSSDSSAAIHVNVFDPVSNAKVGGDLVTLLKPAGSRYAGSQIVALASGDFALAWIEYVSGSSSQILHTQVFDASGTARGAASAVTASTYGMSLAALDSGGYALAYSTGFVMGQIFDPVGSPVGAAFQVNGTPGEYPVITAFGSDDIAISFSASLTDAYGSTTNESPVSFLYSTTTGTSAADTLTGTASRDILRGLDGNDTLIGLGGNDVLMGSAGADVLNGGAGSDYADYSDSNAAVIVNLATGEAHGGYAEGDTLISIERLTGSPFADTLTGDAGDNILLGGAGDDLLVGGAGADYLSGGDGIDTIDYGASAAGVSVDLLGTGHGGDAEGDTYFSIENVRGTGFADVLIGNALANRLEGLAGDDVLIGGAGADTLDGGTGNDTASYANSASAVRVSLTSNAGIGGDAQGDVLISIENLRGSGKNDYLIGNADANILDGGDGDDSLQGMGGADVLIGGAGNDTAIFAYTRAQSVIAVQDNGDILVTTPGGTATLRSIETISFSDITVKPLLGTTADDRLTATLAQPAVYGLAGNDVLFDGGYAATLSGGSGSDVYHVRNAGTTIVEAAGDAGVDTEYTALAYTIIAPGIERLAIEPGKAGQLVGDERGNVLIGGDGADVLEGRGGADLMMGGVGNDIYFVDDVNDLVIEAAGGGIDEVATSVSYTIPAEVEIMSLLHGVVADLTGDARGNYMLGNEYGGALYGLGGDDVLVGNAGDDLIDGGAGVDVARIAGASSAAAIALRANGDIIVTSVDGVDTLRGIEAIEYADRQVATASFAGIDAQYVTYGGRHAYAAELTVWTDAIARGASLATVASAVQNDPTLQITKLYQDYGGRAPDAGEIASWTIIARNAGGFGVVRDGILSDPLGQNHSAAVITDLYQTYGGRAPVAGEIASWSTIVKNGSSLTAVRDGILADPLGANHSAIEIDAQYRHFFGRAPTADETDVWKTIIRSGYTFDALTEGLLIDVGSAAGTTKSAGTAGADIFALTGRDHLAISDFDPFHDRIDLRGLGLTGVDPLDAAHAREIHTVFGTIDTLLTLNGHDILVRNTEIAQLHTSDFLI